MTNDGGPALGSYIVDWAVRLRVPNSGRATLDDMIRQARRYEFAGQIAASIVGAMYTNDSTLTVIDEIAEEGGMSNSGKVVAALALSIADSLIELEAKTRKETK